MHQTLFLMLLLTEKLGESPEKVVSYRPLWTWRTVDARVHTDRYEHGERSVWDDFLNGFARFLIGFHTTFAWFSGYYYYDLENE